MKIAVLGAGGWGTALAILLCKNHNDVYLWSAFKDEILQLREKRETRLLAGIVLPQEINLTYDLDEAVSGAEFLVVAVPSHVVRSVAKMLAKYDNLPYIISVAKGFEEESLQRLSSVISEETGGAVVAVLSGPSHAEEVARNLPTTVVSACEDIGIAERIQDIFMNDTFRVYTNTDVAGIEISGALKNVIALCAGICDGLGYGDNTKAALMTRGIVEITRLGTAMGGRVETFWGLAGIGDLIVTCTSMHSRNRRAGILIGQGKTYQEAQQEVGMVVEGVKSCTAAYRLAKQYGVEMPIVNVAYDVLYNGKSPKDAVLELMLRDKKSE